MNICATTGKTIYKNEKEAQQGLERFLQKMPDYNGEPYFCLYCSNYHFGKKKDKPTKNKRKRT